MSNFFVPAEKRHKFRGVSPSGYLPDLEPETPPAKPHEALSPFGKSQWQAEVLELRARVRDLEIENDNRKKKKVKYEQYK